MSTKRRGSGEGSIRLRKDGRWEARFDLGWTADGRQRKSVFGRTRQEAAIKLREAQAKAATGQPMPDERLSVGSYLDAWLAGLDLRVRPSTARRYAELLRRHAIPSLGTVKLARLTPQRVEALLSDRLVCGLSPRTVWHLRAVLRTALADAVRAGDLSRNPAGLARPPKVENYRVEPMSPTRARAILDAVAGTDLEAPVTTALWTGLRQSELLGLRWADVDLDGRRLRVTLTLQRRDGAWHLEPTKTYKSRRTVALPAPAVDMLSAHRQRQREAQLLAGSRWSMPLGDIVFTGRNGRPLMAATLTHRFHDAQVRAGLTPVRFHDLRHAAATLMLASGVDLKVVSELLGHSTIATTANVYAGVLDSLKVDAADRMTRLMAQ